MKQLTFNELTNGVGCVINRIMEGMILLLIAIFLLFQKKEKDPDFLPTKLARTYTIGRKQKRKAKK